MGRLNLLFLLLFWNSRQHTSLCRQIWRESPMAIFFCFAQVDRIRDKLSVPLLASRTWQYTTRIKINTRFVLWISTRFSGPTSSSSVDNSSLLSAFSLIASAAALAPPPGAPAAFWLVSVMFDMTEGLFSLSLPPGLIAAWLVIRESAAAAPSACCCVSSEAGVTAELPPSVEKNNQSYTSL